ncbi:predicted protein [Sclerotinia sclerotiorum 1980 UF-70]|uniref:Uncharacterized protein n=1 Tax=Sclerotinia sclerotiorum (strain ATCC 18683 / 1980 / Ss-1) TaxID=665079 RepID=A7ET27_SCLS1|nr:predicted protein [Sclerotinia sclerotiorum 1980 UF-70]EDN92619.1 predicted protein [Sclerotinia sclerotiorum 1980 UF-70]
MSVLWVKYVKKARVKNHKMTEIVRGSSWNVAGCLDGCGVYAFDMVELDSFRQY